MLRANAQFLLTEIYNIKFPMLFLASGDNFVKQIHAEALTTFYSIPEDGNSLFLLIMTT